MARYCADCGANVSGRRFRCRACYVLKNPGMDWAHVEACTDDPDLPLDANAADVARDTSTKRQDYANAVRSSLQQVNDPLLLTDVAAKTEAISAAYQEGERERRHIDAIKAKMAAPAAVLWANPAVGRKQWGGR